MLKKLQQNKNNSIKITTNTQVSNPKHPNPHTQTKTYYPLKNSSLSRNPKPKKNSEKKKTIYYIPLLTNNVFK